MAAQFRPPFDPRTPLWLCIDRHFRVRWLRCLQFLEAFDTDQDGVISKDEWEAGKKKMALQYHNALEINIDKLTTR
eukprot:COSAG06_NODE_1856_length_8212_cov_4.060035_4_plen_76_part_00